MTVLATLLVSIGAINWGLISVANFNLVEFLFGNYPIILKIIYGLVGLSGLYSLCSLYTITWPSVKACSISKKDLLK
jgi:uncharacterized membrane protein YuzA (DUF378 family)